MFFFFTFHERLFYINQFFSSLCQLFVFSVCFLCVLKVDCWPFILSIKNYLFLSTIYCYWILVISGSFFLWSSKGKVACIQRCLLIRNSWFSDIVFHFVLNLEVIQVMSSLEIYFVSIHSYLIIIKSKFFGAYMNYVCVMIFEVLTLFIVLDIFISLLSFIGWL